MRSFDTQADYEEYWFGRAEPVKPAGVRPSDKAFLIYFTATWCGACRKLDLDTIESVSKGLGIPMWKVEQTVNDYTAGFCDVRSLPTFMLLRPRTVVGRIGSSNTEEVITWLKSVGGGPSK